MNEQEQFAKALLAVHSFLPESVVATCESLNAHGEWELALSHCRFHLQGVQVPDSVGALLAACEEKFGIGTSSGRPNQSLEPTRVGKPPLAAQLQR